ncbi:hypothetical protein C1631_005945 [Chryseobacterium phosphatilyticum]|uniref:Uncharacterized protein n=1 Tax=Chryseobacterium phosphatilyticum TaxID=475075 RepID=A0A316XE94_9FLAO|nr:hypothetical protein C1631_005945 [Chryseobacterium phosphatilyticum]
MEIYPIGILLCPTFVRFKCWLLHILLFKEREKRGWQIPIQDKKLFVINGWEVLMQVTNVLIVYFYNVKLLSLKLLISKRAKDRINEVDSLKYMYKHTASSAIK